jgi:hypothetical protein
MAPHCRRWQSSRPTTSIHEAFSLQRREPIIVYMDELQMRIFSDQKLNSIITKKYPLKKNKKKMDGVNIDLVNTDVFIYVFYTISSIQHRMIE